MLITVTPPVGGWLLIIKMETLYRERPKGKGLSYNGLGRKCQTCEKGEVMSVHVCVSQYVKQDAFSA